MLPQRLQNAQTQTKQLLMIKIALLLEIQHGTPLPHQELPSQRMLRLLHIQIIPSIFNLILKILLELDSRELLTLRLLQPLTLALMPIRQPLMMRVALLMETQLGTLLPLQEPPSQRMLCLVNTQAMLSIFKLILNSMVDHTSTLTHHMSQPTTPTQRSTMLEPRPPLLLRPKPHQPIPPPLLPLDGTSQHGTNLDPQPLSETFFNLMPKPKVLLALDSKELLTSRLPQPSTPALMQTKQLLMTRTAQPMETQHGTPSLPQEPPSQRMPCLDHIQDMPYTEIDK